MRKDKLSPTLWRTCRVLMNDVRLRLLWAVVTNADQLNVTSVSRLLGIPQPVASNGLRALQARGLIGVRRERYSVYYNLADDRSLPEATALRNAFVEFFETRELENEWTKNMCVILKAFTHFNRLAMLRRLAKGESDKTALAKASGVIVKTIEHHIHLLSRAGLVLMRANEKRLAVYSLVPQSHPIAAELLRQTLNGSLTYFNSATGREENLRLIHDKDGNLGFIELDTRPIPD